jgi:hypothetical protein
MSEDEDGSGTRVAPDTYPVFAAPSAGVQGSLHSKPWAARICPLALGVVTLAAEAHVPDVSVNVNEISVAELVNPPPFKVWLKIPKADMFLEPSSLNDPAVKPASEFVAEIPLRVQVAALTLISAAPLEAIK